LLKKTLIAAGALALLALIAWLSAGRKGSGGKLEVYAEKAAPRDIVAAVTASGEIRPEREVKVGAEVMGEIKRLHAREGQKVSRGSLLVEIDTRKMEQDLRRLRASLDGAKAQLSADEALLRQSEENRRRNHELAEKGYLSTGALENSDTEYQTALARRRASEARLEEARAALARVEEEMQDARVYASMDGVVTRVYLEEGEKVISGTLNIPGTVILELADMSALVAKVNVDEGDVVNLALGQPAEVLADALPDRPFHGRTVKIASAALPGAEGINTFPVEVRIEDADASLLPGMSCDAKIETGRKESVLAVPSGAVVSHEGRKVVFVAAREHKAEMRYVTLGISDETHVEIVEGVRAGEEVVTGPYRALKEMENGASIRTKAFSAAAASGRD
jgi:HlyD family secretion protein